MKISNSGAAVQPVPKSKGAADFKLRCNENPNEGLKVGFDRCMAARNGDIKDSILSQKGISREDFDALPRDQKHAIDVEIDATANIEFYGSNSVGVVRGADGLWYPASVAGEQESPAGANYTVEHSDCEHRRSRSALTDLQAFLFK